MAKLIDLTEIYSLSNSETLRQLVSNVIENDKRFLKDLEDTLSLIINLMRKMFKDGIKIQQLISGDTVY
jgi:hypothetical protein